jgi:hypothetical protein
MDDKLLKKYLEYANTDEALAVLFVKKHLPQAKGHWVDIADCKRYEMSSDNLHFRFVFGGLYQRRIQPQYPQKAAYTFDGKFDERKYYLMLLAGYLSTRKIPWSG